MPRLSVTEPTPAQVEEVIQASVKSHFNYQGVCSTCDATPDTLTLPNGPLWVVDYIRVKIGTGKATFKAAKSLIQNWQHFQLGWSQVSKDTPVVTGQPLAVVAKTLFMWSVNPLRITYVKEGPKKLITDSTDWANKPQSLTGPAWIPGFIRAVWPGASSPRPQPSLKWQFAHGCVAGHMLAGEESFSVEWDPKDDSVWYQVLTFSRPAHLLALVSYPLTRYYQMRFAKDSVKSLISGLDGNV